MTEAPTEQQAPIQLSQAQFEQLLGRLAVGNNAGGGASSSKSVKPERPTIDLDTTEGEWSVFEDNSWNTTAILVIDTQY